MTPRNSPFLSSSDSSTNSESRSPQPVHRVVSVTSILCNESLTELFASPVQLKTGGRHFSAKRITNRIPTNRAKTIKSDNVTDQHLQSTIATTPTSTQTQQLPTPIRLFSKLLQEVAVYVHHRPRTAEELVAVRPRQTRSMRHSPFPPTTPGEEYQRRTRWQPRKTRTRCIASSQPIGPC